MQDRRKVARSRTFFGGVIALHGRRSTMDCLVKNLSQEGAKVLFPEAAIVPDRFDLEIGRKERTFTARMVWRRSNEAGLVFTS